MQENDVFCVQKFAYVIFFLYLCKKLVARIIYIVYKGPGGYVPLPFRIGIA